MSTSLRTPLFIDRLSLTLSPNRRERENIKIQLEALAGNEELEMVRDMYSELLKSYRHAYRLWLSADYCCVIQVHPRKSTNSFMRIEWNPARAPLGFPNPFQCILRILSQCMSDVMEVIRAARITRIDLTFDLPRVEIGSFFVREATGRSTSGHYKTMKEEFGTHGRLNARYIGKKESGRYLLIYDKKQQQRDTQIGGNPSTTGQRARNGSKRIHAHVTRFELRLQNLESIDALLNLENPYSRLLVSSLSGIAKVLTGQCAKFFVAACQWKGLQAVLSDISDRRERKRYKDAIRETAPPSWWDSDAIWSEVPSAYYSALGLELPS